jgi:DNA-binding MarR family transcriptional regulator
MQRTYQRTLESLREIQLSRTETEALTTLYSVGDMDVSLAGVLDEPPDRIGKILRALNQKGLVVSGEHNPVLTAKGQIVVNEYLERVNE